MKGVLDIVDDMNISNVDSYEALLRLRDLCDEDISLIGFLDEKELLLNKIRNMTSCLHDIMFNNECMEEDIKDYDYCDNDYNCYDYYDYYDFYKVG